MARLMQFVLILVMEKSMLLQMVGIHHIFIFGQVQMDLHQQVRIYQIYAMENTF